MGAGHPRLSFELESFTQNQPAHYKVDADYEKRKGSIRSINMWLTGVIFKATSQLNLLQTNQFKQHGLFPELAFYECHSCHRAMVPTRYPIEPLSNNIAPGSVRLDDAALVVLTSILDSLSIAKSADLKTAIKQLHNASSKNKAAVIESAKNLVVIVNSISQNVINKKYTTSQKKGFRKKLLLDASNGKFRDYSSAEQVFSAVETISIDLKDDEQHLKLLDKLYATLEYEDKYYPDQFQVVAKLLLKTL